MKRILQAALTEAEIIELMRILMDEDADGAMLFMQTHFRGKARELLEGG